MKKNVQFSFMTLLLMLAFAGMSWGQTGTVSGVLIDETGDALIGANVVLTNTTSTQVYGTVTDYDGSYSIGNLPYGTYDMNVSYIGYSDYNASVNLNQPNMVMKQIELAEGGIDLESIVVTGVIDLVRDRETPVAVSTISAKEIQLKLGNQEFPEILKTTPSVYTTKTGGGYGDGRISIRGFDNTNVAVIINGQPVNDMENGRVFWSNWAGLQDMASAVEVQRGLGASNLAVPSVGGTINVITKSTLAEEGGYVLGAVGNDGYYKTTVGYNTGRVEKGWSASGMLGTWQGDGYVDGTKGRGFNYLLALGYRFGDHHSVNVNMIGAGQWHHQRDADVSIRDYQNFGEADKDGINRRLNLDWGMRDGEEFTYRRNFYNKPIASFNWDWNISNNTTLATSIYGSWGRGGGTGPRGRNFAITPFRQDLTQALEDGNVSPDFRNADGTINFENVIESNRSGTAYSGGISDFDGLIIGSNGFSEDGVNSNASIRRSSVNSHDWYGAISNLRHKIGNMTVGLGIDGRSYRGSHYRVLNDLLGFDGYYSTGNEFSAGNIVTATSDASPFKNISESDKIDYYNIGDVRWFGVNGLFEYTTDQLSGVIQGGVSTQNYKRIDYYDQLPNISDEYSVTGGYIKGGVNYNISDEHNVFVNAGRIKRQPFFDAVFPNFANNINEDVEAETITSYEIGYGFRSSFLDANVNGYYTTWTNRFLSTGVTLDNGAEGTANYTGVENQHKGIELEFKAKPTTKFRVNGQVSIGDWKYTGQTVATVFDDNQNEIGTQELFIDGAKVGDVAQTTLSIGVDYKVIKGLNLDATYLYYDKIYADFDILDSEFFKADNKGALEIPSYGLLDLGATYNLDFENTGLTFRVNVNNALDNLYIAESNSNIHDIADGYTAYNGISNQNSVWFGFGRTWNASVKFRF